jgi:hypothetical protein
MKTPFLAVVAAVALAAGTPAQQPDKPDKDAEKLPEYPKLDLKNTTAFLNKEKTILAELAGEEGKKKVVRIGLACEVCLREGPLEVFLCRKGTKEHEAVVRVDADAQFIHAALTTAGAKPGTPTEFVDAKGEPKWKAATGTRINVLVHYTKDGKAYQHPAQEWVRDREKTKKEKKDVTIAHPWVFAGSQELVDPCDPTRKFYAANSGDIISISNFPYSMLEMPVEISKDDAYLTYEARTEKIPAQFSKVWVILEPMIEKK